MILNLLDGGKIDQRPLEDVWIESVANLKLSHGSNELFSEGIINAGLNIQTIRADTGLPGVAVFGNDCSLDRRVEISVVENDKWRVTSELQRQLFDRVGALLHEQTADLRGSGESDLPDIGIGAHLSTNLL